MKIAIVGPFSGASLSGLFDFGTDSAALPVGYPGAPLMAVLARELVDRGHRVASITTDHHADNASLEPFRTFEADGLRAYFCPERKRGYRYSNGRWGRALDLFAYERQCLLQALRDFAPDVVHAHWTYEFAWAALDSSYPTVVTAHDSPAKVLRHMPDLYRALRYVMARRVLARAPVLTCVSPDLAHDLKAYTPTPVSVVANPVTSDILDGVGCAPACFDANAIMMVQNGWNGMKNGVAALRAFQAARRTRASLTLDCFGVDWQPGGPAHRWAAAHSADAGVVFHGPVARAAILDRMHSATALLHPSRVEACSMVIAEAMSLGLPVIAGRDTGGVRWQLDDGRAGELIDVESVDDIARGLLHVISDRDAWERVSRQARHRAREFFAADRVVDRYLSIYASVTSVAGSLHPGSVPAMHAQVMPVPTNAPMGQTCSKH